MSDWEEKLSQKVGDPLAFHLGYAAKQFKNKTQNLADDAKQTLAEYLHYELELLPHKVEMQEFAQEVAELEKRLAKLETQLASQDK